MFPYCQFKAGTATPTEHGRRQCRAMPTFEVADTAISDPFTGTTLKGWFGLGTFCTGHAISVTAAVPTRAMRPLPVTVEVLGKR